MDSVIQSQTDDEEYVEHLAFLRRILKVTMELPDIYRRDHTAIRSINENILTAI